MSWGFLFNVCTANLRRYHSRIAFLFFYKRDILDFVCKKTAVFFDVKRVCFIFARPKMNVLDMIFF